METEKGIQYKLFAGFKISAELRDCLLKSKKWKESKIDKTITPLTEVKYEEHHFIGIYLNSQALSLNDISAIEETLNEHIKQLCLQFNPLPLSLRFFSQPFIQ